MSHSSYFNNFIRLCNKSSTFLLLHRYLQWNTISFWIIAHSINTLTQWSADTQSQYHISPRCFSRNFLLALIRPIFFLPGRRSCALFVFWSIPFSFFFSNFLNWKSCTKRILPTRMPRIRIISFLQETFTINRNMCQRRRCSYDKTTTTKN